MNRYVYVDDDTYVLWQPLLELLRRRLRGLHARRGERLRLAWLDLTAAIALHRSPFCPVSIIYHRKTMACPTIKHHLLHTFAL